MAEKVKVNSRILFLKKQIVFFPLILLLPLFFFAPSSIYLVNASILIVHYFLCFMGPIYIVRALIDKLSLSQSLVNIFAVISIVCMYFFTFLNWFLFFTGLDGSYTFYSALFLIPFLSFIKVLMIILPIAVLYFLFALYKKRKNESWLCVFLNFTWLFTIFSLYFQNI